MTSYPLISLLIFIVISVVVYFGYKLINSGWIRHNILERKKTLIEDILKQLYHVEYSGRVSSLRAMAGALRISDRKLIKYVEEMSKSNLVTFENDSLVLTESGRDYALKIIRVHRLWEKYLSEKTGFDRSEWHDLAERKEHELTPEQTERLSRQLGRPRFDPHGDPIPTSEGEISDPNWKTLSSLKENARARIIHIEDEPASVYKQIIDKKLHIGSQVKVIGTADNEIRFYSEGNEYEISPIVASNISVEELNTQELFEEDTVRLSSLGSGERAKILGISSECRGANRRRLLDLGFTKGSTIEAEFESPMREPKAYSIRNTIIALRSSQADLILIEKEK